MSDLSQRLRDFIDAGARPVAADEIFVASKLVDPDDLQFKAPRPRRHVLIKVGAAVLVAAIVSVTLIVVPSSPKSQVQKASAATVFKVLKAAATAARSEPALIPGRGQYLYVALLEPGVYGQNDPGSPSPFWYFADNLVQTWTSPVATGLKRYDVVGRPQFLTARDRAVWAADGSKPLESGSDTFGATPYYNVADLPTSPSAMKRYFATQSYLQTSPPSPEDSSFEFNSALQFLLNGASSKQRAALLKFIATLPGVSLVGNATSVATHEKGTGIEMTTDRKGQSEEAIINPATSNLIEIRYVVADPAKYRPVVSIGSPTSYVKGEVLSYTDYLFDGLAVLGKLPLHSPELPPVWPFGATRIPLPGSVTP